MYLFILMSVMETFSCKSTVFGLIYFGSKGSPANFVCTFVNNAFVQFCLYAILYMYYIYSTCISSFLPH